MLLQGADLFALTSYSENFGIAVLEALAAGRPVLVTRPVALSEIVTTANLGYVADTDVDDITSKLSRALDDIENSVFFSQRALDFVAQNHQWPVIGKQLSVLYKNLVAQEPK